MYPGRHTRGVVGTYQAWIRGGAPLLRVVGNTRRDRAVGTPPRRDDGGHGEHVRFAAGNARRNQGRRSAPPARTRRPR